MFIGTVQAFSILRYNDGMRLQLIIRSGPATGQAFDVIEGAVIGRASTAQISFPDSKLSGRHARIERNQSGQLILTDLGSTNGIRLEKRRVAHIELTKGVVFRAGNTTIEVISAPDAQPGLHESIKAIEPPPPPKRKTPLTWDEYLAGFAKRALSKVKNQPIPLIPFDPLLILTVVRGDQIGTQWVMGYGPREIGQDTLEFHVLDSPPLAFRVTPRDGLALYETPHPKQVKLNGAPAATETLHAGDEIQISNTIIKVSYKE